MGCGGKTGYYFSSTCVIVGSLSLFFIDLHRRSLARHKHNDSGVKKLCVSEACPQRRRLSFTAEPEELVVVEQPPVGKFFNNFLVKYIPFDQDRPPHQKLCSVNYRHNFDCLYPLFRYN